MSAVRKKCPEKYSHVVISFMKRMQFATLEPARDVLKVFVVTLRRVGAGRMVIKSQLPGQDQPKSGGLKWHGVLTVPVPARPLSQLAC